DRKATAADEPLAERADQLELPARPADQHDLLGFEVSGDEGQNQYRRVDAAAAYDRDAVDGHAATSLCSTRHTGNRPTATPSSRDAGVSGAVDWGSRRRRGAACANPHRRARRRVSQGEKDGPAKRERRRR